MRPSLASGLLRRRSSSCRQRGLSSSSLPSIQRALVRPVSPLLPKALSSVPQPLSYKVASAQHDHYTSILASILGPDNVIHCPVLEEHADSCFVEDTCVILGTTAVLNRLGHVSRQAEVDSVRDCLPTEITNIVDMRLDKEALCDGGDILFTGRHLFCGLSSRTNHQGCQVLREAFGNEEVVPVPIPADQALHLKSIITHLDEETLVVPTGALGNAVVNTMEAEKLGYHVLRVPNVLAANVVRVNEHLLVPKIDCEASLEILQRAADDRNLTVHSVDMSELAKCDGALTCCSVLLTV